MRPKLLRDVAFMPVRDGVSIQSSRLQCTLKGHALYELISHLAPHLNGDTTLKELTSRLEEEKRQSVTRLIELLAEKGFVKDHDPEATVALSAAERACFAPQLNFIGHFDSTPCQKFLRFPNSRIAVFGAGVALTALGVSLLRNGLRHFLLLSADERTHRDADKEKQRLAESGVESSFEYAADIAAQPPCEMLLYAAGNGDLAEVWRLNRESWTQGVAFLSGVVVGAESLTGPLVTARGAGGR